MSENVQDNTADESAGAPEVNEQANNEPLPADVLPEAAPVSVAVSNKRWYVCMPTRAWKKASCAP